MHALFPDILFLGPFFAPVILRIAAAIAFFALAEHLYRNREALRADRFPIIGTPHNSVIWLWILISAALALMFAAGVFTQLAALFGFGAALKMAFFSKKHPVLPYNQAASIVIALVCATLFVTGAGAFAFDLPF